MYHSLKCCFLKGLHRNFAPVSSTIFINNIGVVFLVWQISSWNNILNSVKIKLLHVTCSEFLPGKIIDFLSCLIKYPMLMTQREIWAFLMLSFPSNLAELCDELHFLLSNFLSSMLLFRYHHFLTPKDSRFTKSFKSKLMTALTRKAGWLHCSVKKNCHPLKVLPNCLHPKKFSISTIWSLYCAV